MIWAIVDHKKIEATPQKVGYCPHCGEKVISKCGDIYVWHWAHSKSDNCDSWDEHETYWHKHWKMTFGKAFSEIGITKNSKRHIADIYTKNKIVIELQNSPISKSIINQREEFYGERMIWIINGQEFKKNLSTLDYWEDDDYREMMSLPRLPVRWQRSSPEIVKGPNGEFFKWKYPRKSWCDAKRHIFIDFNQKKLFKVKDGMGTSRMRGTFVSKERFINKYGGNYEYYLKHKNKSN